ncbi:MAG: hypothetical protein HOJ29_01990, partial [Candidatus Magasanikbacteria bacterium]|nr:hypothetical protein [Candidatus Magasanikbacteria bacterium]
QEETGIDITTYNKDLLSDTRRGQSTKILPNKEEVLCTMCFKEYKVSIHDKEALHIEVRVEDDLAEYQWVDINDIKNIQLTPPSKELFLELGYL